MITEIELKLLKNFFGSYFHQDWDLEAKSPEEAVSMYMSESSKQNQVTLSKSIIEYAEQYPNDDELLQKLLLELKCSYWPLADGLTARTWLKFVAAQLAGTVS